MDQLKLVLEDMLVLLVVLGKLLRVLLQLLNTLLSHQLNLLGHLFSMLLVPMPMPFLVLLMDKLVQ